MSPVIARLHNRKNGDGIRSNLIAVCRWIFIIQLGLTIPMVIFGDKLLSLFGPEFAIGALVLTAVLAAELINGTFLTAETALIFEKPKIPPTLLVMTLIVEVTLIAFLSAQWGTHGAAVGFLMTTRLFPHPAKLALLLLISGATGYAVANNIEAIGRMGLVQMGAGV